MDAEKLKEARDFYENRIKNWMISDLRRSIEAKTNLLTALGCLIYTEVIGILLPPLRKETGAPKQKRFYRCLFRLKSGDYLVALNKFIFEKTNKGIYEQFRHNMAHRYYAAVIKKQNREVSLFMPTIITRDGFSLDRQTNTKARSSPIFIDVDGRITLATKNYTDELGEAVDRFCQYTFIDNQKEFQEAAIKGIDFILRDRS